MCMSRSVGVTAIFALLDWSNKLFTLHMHLKSFKELKSERGVLKKTSEMHLFED